MKFDMKICLALEKGHRLLFTIKTDIHTSGALFEEKIMYNGFRRPCNSKGFNLNSKTTQTFAGYKYL